MEFAGESQILLDGGVSTLHIATLHIATLHIATLHIATLHIATLHIASHFAFGAQVADGSDAS